MGRIPETELARHWAGLAILERLSEAGSELSSEEVSAILGTRNAKGIGSALRPTGDTLNRAGIRFDETVSRRTVRGRIVWTGGPRVRQAVQVLEQERSRWMNKRRQDAVPLVEVQSDHPGPVLVLRALKSRQELFRVLGGMSELDEFLEVEWLDIGEGKYEVIGEIFIDRIEPGADGCKHPIPEGYGENGIWVRGTHDYARPGVAGGIGSGMSPMIACVGIATWVERRIALVDAVRQLEAVRAAEDLLMLRDTKPLWHDVEAQKSFLYVNWIGARGIAGPSSAPPLRMRLRCWYEIVIETAAQKRVVLREEGLRGDDERTVTRAIARWRESNAASASEQVLVREFRIAKRQPRPMPP